MLRFAPLLLAAALLVSCGDDDDVTTAEPETTTTTTVAETTTTEVDEPDEPDEPVELPGDPIEIFPFEGDEVGVVGVEADDVLNVRSGPGVQFDIVAELEPLATGVVATGHNRSLNGADIWAEVEADGATGWVNTAYLAYLGDTEDVTYQIAGAPGGLPQAETMLELGDAVADTRTGNGEGEMTPDVVVVDGPTVADLGEITIDIVGLADDSVLGERLRIFAEPDPGGESFTVRTVESTTLCRRGVTDDGLCV
jgi:hypothetical protein